jgi:hypothetical protein
MTVFSSNAQENGEAYARLTARSATCASPLFGLPVTG